MSRFLLAALALTIVLGGVSVNPNSRVAVQLTRAYASQDATSAWNTYCAGCEFPPLTGTTPIGWTYQDAWDNWGGGTHTGTFASRFAAIKAAVANAMGTQIPPDAGDDTFSAHVTNWPNP